MKTNIAARTEKVFTHEGGKAVKQKPLLELTRAVSSCLLFENTFYEGGDSIANRIAALCEQVAPVEIQALAIRARNDLKLRHVPLFLCVQLARLGAGPLTREAIAKVVQRPDEMGELLALYWRDGKKPIAASIKKGLADAFPKFDEYQLAKWNRDGKVKLRDVLFLCHAKPKDEEQDAIWKRMIDGKLTPSDTWEVALSGGEDKKAVFERLIQENRLGYMALLMNLRNMVEAGVSHELVARALMDGARGSKALPFRFVSAAKFAPAFAQSLSDAMELSIDGQLPGGTALLVDRSGSMDVPISDRSTLNRWEAAAALAVLVRGMADRCRVFAFSDEFGEVQSYKGLGLVDAMGNFPSGGTYLKSALEKLKATGQYDRVIVVTDEQSHDGILSAWTPRAYLINVAGYEPGLDMSQGWQRVNGWSDRIVQWIQEEERMTDQ